jgi:hypothetical protein
MKPMNKMLHRWMLLCAVIAAAVMPAVQAQQVDAMPETGDMVRVMRHPDGTRAIYQRQQGWRGMRCSTYAASGRLAAVNDYTEGKYGQLVGCIVYDHTKKNIIYKVAYGYDSRARLVEERMYSHPEGKLVQRVIYKYDSRGNRSKPLIVSLNTAGPATEIAPTMEHDVNAINREMKSRAAGRR